MSATVRKVAVLIVSWNGRDHLEVLLPALEGQVDPGVEWETWVFDNGSSDGTVEWLKEHHPRVRFVESPTNLGFCGANNRLATACDADALVLLNNDTRPYESWLAALVDALKSSPDDVAAISGLITDWEGQRLDFAEGVMTFDGHAFQFGFRSPLDLTSLPASGDELLFPCGGNMIVRRESFLAAGGFDERYFAYLEDVDLGWRLWAGGERATFNREAVVRHRSMATSDRLGHQNRGTLFERNALNNAYKNFDSDLWPQLLPAVLLTFLSRIQTLLSEHNPGGDLLALDPYDGLIADTGAGSSTSVAERLRRHGWLGSLKRAVRRVLLRWQGKPAGVTVVEEVRTMAQLRALSFFLNHLEEIEESRQQAQARRRRSDREIFERFPLHVIPTYPGDERLFSGAAFRETLPRDLPVRFLDLAEVMELDDD